MRLSHKAIRRSAICCLATLSIDCNSVRVRELPAGSIPVQAPSVYELWWQVTQACSGLHGNLSDVTWYVVPGVSTFQVAGKTYAGYWFPEGNEIVVAERAKLEGQVVRHEMLHALVRKAGHSGDYFISKCGGIVACQGQCLADAGVRKDPPANSPTVDVADLEAHVSAQAQSQQSPSTSGWVVLIISVTNPRPYAVGVSLSPVGIGSTAYSTFGYELGYCLTGCGRENGYTYTYTQRFSLYPGETLRYAFDEQLEPGKYTVVGTFNGSLRTAPTSFVIE
jgi:hypothetical protein